MAFDPTQVQPAVDNSGNLVASAAPDVQPTTAPDLSAVTGGPASPPPPAGTADTGDYQGAVPVARPGATDFKAGFRSGVTSATPAQYTMDSDGNLVRSNAGAPPKGGMAKAGGILGGILQGALEGASRGVAAQQGESGAAAAQRIGAQQDQVARAQAQQNFENTRAKQKDLLEHNLLTLQMTNLVKKSQYEADEHAQNLKRWGFENDENALKQHANDSGERLALANFNAELNQHAVQPIHTITKKSGDVDVTPQGPVQAGQNPTTILGQAATHAPNLVNGKATMIQNGGVGDSNGVHIYSTDDLKQPITKRFYYQVPTGLTKDDGTADMDDRVIDPDGKTTYYDVLGQINNANQQLDLANKKIGQQMTAAKSKADVEKTAAETRNQLAEAAKNSALAKAAVLGLTQGDPSKTGEDYISTLPPQSQDLVHGLLQYQVKPSDLGRAKDRAAILAAAVHADASHQWSQAQYEERYNYLKEYGDTQKGAGATRDRLNTAVGHLDMLAQASQALAQNNVQVLNQIANSVGVAAGKSPKVVYDAIAQKAAGETAAAIKGGGAAPTDPEIEAARKQFDSKMSPQQQLANIRAQFGILKTQADTVGSHFQSIMKTTPDQFGQPVLFPQNQGIMQKWTNVGGATQLTNLHTNGQQTIGWNGTAWLDAKTLQPVTVQGRK